VTSEAVAILGGTGPEGRGLALRFARAGVPVVIGSRDAARAADIAAALAPGDGLPLSGAANPDAARQAEVVLVAIVRGGRAGTGGLVTAPGLGLRLPPAGDGGREGSRNRAISA